MPTITLTVRNKNNTGLVMNSIEILALYFYGIGITNKMGTVMDRSVIDFYVKSAQKEIERYLSIKLIKQVMEERDDFYRNEFNGRGFVKTKYTVNKPLLLAGYLGEFMQISYPTAWLTSNLTDGYGTARQMIVVPNSNVSDFVTSAAVYGGSVIPYLGLLNGDQIGNYWKKRYITGWGSEDIPMELMNLVGKLASIGVFNILGDIALGTAALASYSLSIDGLSQSISTTNSATNAAFGARILNYQKEIKETLNKLFSSYRGVTFTSI